MRTKLQQYVELLFAGVPDSEEIKEEILQNTLDRYDDLISQGKVPEAAYRLAIAGIGDVGEILGTGKSAPKAVPTQEEPPAPEDPSRRKTRALAIGMYIASPIPLFILSELGNPTMGLCFTLLLVAAATAALLMARNPAREDGNTPHRGTEEKTDRSPLGLLTLVLYLVLSFTTGAWYITWLVFPIMGAVRGLLRSIRDLKEAMEHEN